MKLIRITNKYLTSAHKIALSKKYVFCCTSGSISILERQSLDISKKITDISHICDIIVSPDETCLLVLTTVSIFYIIHLNDFSIKRYSITGKYTCNCAIQGCWSFDSNSVLIPVYCGSTGTSALRQYNFSETQESEIIYTDMMENKYYIKAIVPSPSIEKYFLIGIDRNKQDHNKSDYYTLITFNGKSFDEYPLPEFDDNISPSHIEYDANTHIITLRGLIGLSASFEEKNKKFCRVENNSTMGFKCNTDTQENINHILKAIGCEQNDVNEIIPSSNRCYYYVSSNQGLYVVDKETFNITSRVRIKHGIEKTVEFGSRYIGVATLDGLRMYEILEE